MRKSHRNKRTIFYNRGEWKMKKRFLSFLIVMCMFLINIPVNATCSAGINGNGTGGIYIDINSAPYTTIAGYSYGEYAYTSQGCAWFASARVNQLTGKGNVIRSATNWWNNCGSYGFNRGSTPQAGSIICLTKGGGEHVAIIEKIEGSTAYISEGGYGSAGASHGYCTIRTVNVSQIASQYATASFGGYSLLGYVYFGDKTTNVTPPTAILSINKSDYAKNEDVTFTFGGENVSNVFTLGIYKDNNRIDTVNVNGSTYTRSFSEVGNYSAYMTSYNDAGYADSNWVNWSVLGKPEATLSVDKSKCDTNTNVTFTFNGGNNDVFTFGIYRNGERIDTETVKSNTYTKKFSEPGFYSAYMTSYNNANYADSNWIYWEVYESDFIPTTINIYNNHIYSLYEQVVSWKTAKEFCEKMGGHLVTVTSKDESDFINQLSKNGKVKRYWLGATDEDGKWKWVTGETFNFVNWCVGEPNNAGNVEHYMDLYDNSNWNDSENNSSYGFILEVELPLTSTDTIQYNNHKYVRYDFPLNWTEAETFCKQQGGHLATITSEAENNAIKQLLENAAMDRYWIGAKRTNDKWAWVSNEDFQYTNWYVNEPNNTLGIENYLEIYNNTGWNDNKNCRLANGGFICEIENSDTKPTPTPTVKPTVTLTPTETPYDGLAVTAKKVTAKAGSEVDIPISISKNPGIAGFKFKISYDKSVLIPISITKGSAFGNGTLNSNINQGGDLSKLDEVTAYWSNPSNVSADGEMFTVKFKVSDNATDGTYPITLTYEDGDITNQTFDNINPKITNGAVTLTKVKKGDIYEDGVVNTKDGVLLSQYLAKWNINFTENQMTAADVYEDGVVNTKDGVKLSQVLAKWDNVTLSSEISASADGIAVSIPNIDTNAGEYIDVPVTLSKNSGIAGFNFNINYDTSALTPVSITAGDILSDGTFTSNLLQDSDLSHLEYVTAYWNNPSNITDNGTLFTIRFKVNENANGTLPITVTYNDGDICNQEFENVNADITNGAINVSASVTGKYYEIASAKITNVAGEEVDTIPQNGNFTVNTTINELAKYSGNSKLYCVLYDDNDLLVSITNADISDKTNYEFAIPNMNKNIAKIKLFVWNTFSGMKPLSDSVTIE